ncbi:hypothetical protein MSAN_01088000 [Mycena sanguinolenta]|uniref:DUF6533 domain-containing protein n=1 Tax=Mycena sanguinolenta TaxID=230812 RepID=A0A8H6YTZ0_9AGAR|nr:hypothetical protein MSAN_01088000 [Mycena sanguinolenta]
MDGLNTPVYDLQLVSRIDVGMLTVLTYDTLLNVDQEYRLVWQSPWSIVKFLYLFARYSPFVDGALGVHIRTQLGITPETCHIMTGFARIFAVLGTIITELILTVRTYALYEQSLSLLSFLAVMWLAITGVNIWALVQWTGSLIPVSMSTANSCNLDSHQNIGITIYASILAGETIIVLLTAWKGLHTFWLSRSIYRHSQLITTFYRDGLLFYLAIFVILVVDVSLELQAPPGLKFIADSSLRAMQSILACHLVLHGRSVAREETYVEDSGIVLDTMSVPP